MQPDDTELLRRISLGDSVAFRMLYKRYESSVYNYLSYLESDRALVRDLFQEVWLRVVRQTHRSKEIHHFRAWLFAVASNVYRDVLRRRRLRRRWFSARTPDTEPGAEARKTPEDVYSGANRQFQNLEFRRDLERALKRLPPRQRQVFVLKEIEGLKHEEIAEILGISTGACKSTLHHAVQALRKQLKSYENQAGS